MYCLANICYVCLEKKDKLLSDITSSLSVNKDIMYIIGYLPFNLTWLKSLRIILICEECCSRLRETYKFLEKCLKNSALLQGYMDNLNTTPVSNIDNRAELLVKLNITREDINEKKCEIQSQDEEIYTFQWKPNIKEIDDVFVDFEDSLIEAGIICKNDKSEHSTVNNSTETIEETEDVFVNLEDSFVKEENTWKQEEAHDIQEFSTDNYSTEIIDVTEDVLVDIAIEDSRVKEAIISETEVDDKPGCPTVNNSTYIVEETNDVFINVEDSFVKEENTWKREEVDDTEECPTEINSTESIDNEPNSELPVNDNGHLTNTDCGSSGFTDKQAHATNENDLNEATKSSYKCSTCGKSFVTQTELNIHTQVHTDKKSYECAICKKLFNRKDNLTIHMRVHTGEKPYECATCKTCFSKRSYLVLHMRTHTGEKPFQCPVCKSFFSRQLHLVLHMRAHTGEKPFECATCKKYFSSRSYLALHMRTHTGERPY